MIIDGKGLSEIIAGHLKTEVKSGKAQGWSTPKLVIFTVLPTHETQAYLRNKTRFAEAIGAEVQVITYREAPRYIEFAQHVAEMAQDPATTGIIIQYPLPASLETVSLLDYIPVEKEIEGFKKKSPFMQPIGLAVLTMLKSVFSPEHMDSPKSVIIDMEKDTIFFRNVFKRKKTVLLGKGKTGGEPIGNTLSKAHINYINITTQSPAGDDFISQAHIIISAVGKNAVEPGLLKRGIVLISVGLHKENDTWVGDYDEEKIKDIAYAYSPTPGGVGPLNIAYLYYNLILAWKIQNDPSYVHLERLYSSSDKAD